MILKWNILDSHRTYYGTERFLPLLARDLPSRALFSALVFFVSMCTLGVAVSFIFFGGAFVPALITAITTTLVYYFGVPPLVHSHYLYGLGSAAVDAMKAYEALPKELRKELPLKTVRTNLLNASYDEAHKMNHLFHEMRDAHVVKQKALSAMLPPPVEKVRVGEFIEELEDKSEGLWAVAEDYTEFS